MPTGVVRMLTGVVRMLMGAFARSDGPTEATTKTVAARFPGV